MSDGRKKRAGETVYDKSLPLKGKSEVRPRHEGCEEFGIAQFKIRVNVCLSGRSLDGRKK